MIPPILHQCWFGPKPIPEKHRNWMAGVRAVMPGFRYRLWTDADLPDNRFVRECLRWKKYALLSDWARLEILVREGGFYLDTDIEAFKSLEPLREHPCVLGFDACIVPGKPVGNAIMGAEPGNPFMRDCLRNFVRGLNRYPKPPYGVKTLNQDLFRLGLEGRTPQCLGGVAVLDRDVLFREYTCHHFEGSWHSRKGFRSALRSIGYRGSRILVLAAAALSGKTPYPGVPHWHATV